MARKTAKMDSFEWGLCHYGVTFSVCRGWYALLKKGPIFDQRTAPKLAIRGPQKKGGAGPVHFLISEKVTQ